MSGNRGSSQRGNSNERRNPAASWPPVVNVELPNVYRIDGEVWGPNPGSHAWGVYIRRPDPETYAMIGLNVPRELREVFNGMVEIDGNAYSLEARRSTAVDPSGRPAEYILQQRTARSAPPSRTSSPQRRDISRATAWPATVHMTVHTVDAVGGTVLLLPGSSAPPAMYNIWVPSQDANVQGGYFPLNVPNELHAAFLDVVWEYRAHPNLEARSSPDVDSSGRPREYRFQQRTPRSASASASRTPSPPMATGDSRTLRSRSHSTDAGRRIGFRELAQALDARTASPPRGRSRSAQSASNANSIGAAVPPPVPSPPHLRSPHRRASSVVTTRSVSASGADSTHGRPASRNGFRNPSPSTLPPGSASRQARLSSSGSVGEIVVRNSSHRSHRGSGALPSRPIPNSTGASARSPPRGRSPAAGTVS